MLFAFKPGSYKMERNRCARAILHLFYFVNAMGLEVQSLASLQFVFFPSLLAKVNRERNWRIGRHHYIKRVYRSLKSIQLCGVVVNVWNCIFRFDLDSDRTERIEFFLSVLVEASFRSIYHLCAVILYCDSSRFLQCLHDIFLPSKINYFSYNQIDAVPELALLNVLSQPLEEIIWHLNNTTVFVIINCITLVAS